MENKDKKTQESQPKITSLNNSKDTQSTKEIDLAKMIGNKNKSR